ncbi:hypothetical protein Msub_11604 [Marinobacter subterrani]|uniref:Uncharacterized protein n=1 Tax=Marinobacter subterrani TaxID=1658765 RepID=A0A0J7M2Z8_9GAMM|nr:hypothetical protein Msub_11604 [Marinobacter subterrani]
MTEPAGDSLLKLGQSGVTMAGPSINLKSGGSLEALNCRMAHPAGAKGNVLPPTGNLGTLYRCHPG